MIRSLKILLKSERVLIARELKLAFDRFQLVALAGLIAVFGLALLDVAAVFALQPYWGSSLSALAVGGANLLLALILIASAKSLSPGEEIEMVKEVRDMAITEIEEEVSRAQGEIVVLRDEARRFVRNPFDAFLPSILAPLFSTVVKGVTKRKKSAE